ncbi:density-regulated protein DRP1 [Schizopora paradoxa]|uniref:Translation machinery-associated protein 22 n=1 Tax=Schizopora paradoxa TaxID=27342 RepID=A0A0H2R7W5_9AGAM|nr:density-regulated protein DRP1 [Schizopora paradoxa]
MSSENASNAQTSAKEDDNQPQSSGSATEVEKEAVAAAPISVLFCDVCSFPVEYCEFGTSLTRCKEALQKSNPELFNKYYSEETLQSRMGTLSLEKQAKLEKDIAKAEKKAEKKADAAEKKKKESIVTIKRIERTKRKHVTAIHGLEAFDIQLKPVAKYFAQRFATGASVTKNAQGQDEIVVQGDVADDILEMIEEGKVKLLKGVPSDNVELVEDKKKKAAEEEE